MSYSMPQWNDEEIRPLFEAAADAFVWADRYKDAIMLHYIRLILNLAYARMPFSTVYKGVKDEDNDDT